MCKSANEGGQRPSGHTKPAFDRRDAELADARWDRNGVRVAEDAWAVAATEYASTPSGAAVLEARLAGVTDDRETAMLRGALDGGKAMRAANREAAAKIKAAAGPRTSRDARGVEVLDTDTVTVTAVGGNAKLRHAGKLGKVVGFTSAGNVKIEMQGEGKPLSVDPAQLSVARRDGRLGHEYNVGTEYDRFAKRDRERAANPDDPRYEAAPTEWKRGTLGGYSGSHYAKIGGAPVATVHFGLTREENMHHVYVALPGVEGPMKAASDDKAKVLAETAVGQWVRDHKDKPAEWKGDSLTVGGTEMLAVSSLNGGPKPYTVRHDLPGIRKDLSFASQDEARATAERFVKRTIARLVDGK